MSRTRRVGDLRCAHNDSVARPGVDRNHLSPNCYLCYFWDVTSCSDARQWFVSRLPIGPGLRVVTPVARCTRCCCPRTSVPVERSQSRQRRWEFTAVDHAQTLGGGRKGIVAAGGFLVRQDLASNGVAVWAGS
jgi:hypothetical protein